MHNATIAIIGAEVVLLLQSKGYISATEDFDPAKFDNVQADTELAAGIESILKKHGVPVSGKVDSILQLLPLLMTVIK